MFAQNRIVTEMLLFFILQNLNMEPDATKAVIKCLDFDDVN